MAEVIGLASGLVALATFALQSSQVLHEAVNSFKSHERVIRDLREEVKALDGVLKSLCQTVANSDAELAGLERPLLQCGKGCLEFGAFIASCNTHSNGSKTSVRDWAAMKLKGEDLAGFRNMLAGYKSTISIALGDANFRTAIVTVEVLREYKELIADTTSDLNDRLQKIDSKLQDLFAQATGTSQEDLAEKSRINDEKESTQQCLRICAQVSEHLDQVQPRAFEATRSASDTRKIAIETLTQYLSALRATGSTMKECKDNLDTTTSELRQHLREMDSKLEKAPRGGSMSMDQLAEQERIREERKSTEQCLGVCAQAAEQVDQVRTNVVEDVSAASDSHQVAVATLGDLISAKRITAGARSTQWLGQMSDTSLQQLSRAQGSMVTSKSMGQTGSLLELQDETAEDFKGRHGAGYKLDINTALGKPT